MTDLQMRFQSEEALRSWVVEGLRPRLKDRALILSSKNVNDIVICIERSSGPRALFVEVKYATIQKGRIGIGDGRGVGFQPEILVKQPSYFEAYTRWLVAAESGKAVLVDNAAIRSHAMGKLIVEGKQNNLKPSVFDEGPFEIEDAIERIAQWVESVP
ncbi:MAG: hypothetical protein HY268_14690 [Deltaproteobacteria bacterium]|nr:hypothetical protein [Deltaproteobacteria bacterium]